MVSATMLVHATAFGLFAYLVKSAMLSARVALGAMAEVIAEKNTTASGVEPGLLPWEKIGPNPCARPTAHPTKKRRERAQSEYEKRSSLKETVY